jgi:hypothetical protein
MNNTKKRNLTSMFAILLAATLVVGTIATAQSAFAYPQKKGKGGDENSRNGNTITIQKCKLTLAPISSRREGR